MEKKKHKIQEVSSSQNKQDSDVAYFVAFFLLLEALKKYKRLRYGLYFSLFIILVIIVAIGLVISCQWIGDNNTKLFFLGGIGWLLAYWFTKSKELSQNRFNLKKQYYCDFISKVLQPNISNTELEIVVNITCLFASDDVKEGINQYRKEYLSSNPSLDILNQLRQEIFSKMQQDLYLANFDLIDCFRYFLKIRKNKHDKD